MSSGPNKRCDTCAYALWWTLVSQGEDFIVLNGGAVMLAYCVWRGGSAHPYNCCADHHPTAAKPCEVLIKKEGM